MQAAVTALITVDQPHFGTEVGDGTVHTAPVPEWWEQPPGILFTNDRKTLVFLKRNASRVTMGLTGWHL